MHNEHGTSSVRSSTPSPFCPPSNSHFIPTMHPESRAPTWQGLWAQGDVPVQFLHICHRCPWCCNFKAGWVANVCHPKQQNLYVNGALADICVKLRRPAFSLDLLKGMQITKPIRDHIFILEWFWSDADRHKLLKLFHYRDHILDSCSSTPALAGGTTPN